MLIHFVSSIFQENIQSQAYSKKISNLDHILHNDCKNAKKRTKQTNNTNLSLSNRWRLPQFICRIVCICFTFNCAHNLLMYFLQRVSCFEVFSSPFNRKKTFLPSLYCGPVIVKWNKAHNMRLAPKINSS